MQLQFITVHGNESVKYFEDRLEMRQQYYEYTSGDIAAMIMNNLYTITDYQTKNYDGMIIVRYFMLCFNRTGNPDQTLHHAATFID